MLVNLQRLWRSGVGDCRAGAVVMLLKVVVPMAQLLRCQYICANVFTINTFLPVALPLRIEAAFLFLSSAALKSLQFFAAVVVSFYANAGFWEMYGRRY